MSPKFFVHKMREVASFLQIMKGKITGSKQERIKGVDNALDAMKDERQVYLDEKQEALNKSNSRTKKKFNGNNEKVIRESSQDISAI